MRKSPTSRRLAVSSRPLRPTAVSLSGASRRRGPKKTPSALSYFRPGRPADREVRRLTHFRWVSPTYIVVCSALADWPVAFTLPGSLGWTCDRLINLKTTERRGRTTRAADRATVDIAVHPISSHRTHIATAEADGSFSLHCPGRKISAVRAQELGTTICRS
jgi:hypothetical protein